MWRRLIPVALVAFAWIAPGVWAGPDEHTERAKQAMHKAVEWMRSRQDKARGGWALPPEQPAGSPGKGTPVYPAVTALAINGMLEVPGVDAGDPAVAAGVRFLLESQQPDGGIYDRVLPSYNTSIALSALSRVEPKTPAIRAAIARAQNYLMAQQWGAGKPGAGVPNETKGDDTPPREVGKDDPFYGGVGYGHHGRPDLSNVGMMLQGLHDSGVSADDAAFKRALVFLQRLQMLDSVNDMAYADGSTQGGFIYSQTPSGESVEGPAGQTYAGTIEETMDDGTKVSRLRCYGSMSYTGFKSYIYAGLKKDDERVKAAYGWCRRNYTVEENPGMKGEGLYYYLVAMTRALHAWGEPTIEAIKSDGSTETRNWANDVIDRLAGLQNEDGSFKPVEKRWMESNPELITAYSLIALGEAVQAKEEKK